MRNLKKVLALVLALVMSLSLVTIANASIDFTDADDVKYEEAVDVMSSIGVIEGFETGAFNPNGTLTREQAAKIIAYMLLGTEAAEKLGPQNTGFTDVPSTRWSSPYIGYCVSLGIVNGNGDGTFSPSGTLTGYAFAKMLLVALGYGVNDEYVGAGWTLAVARDGMQIGLYDEVSVSNAAITRDEACQLAFDTLRSNLVVWSELFNTYTAYSDLGNQKLLGTLGGNVFKLAATYKTDDYGYETRAWRQENKVVTDYYFYAEIIDTVTDPSVTVGALLKDYTWQTSTRNSDGDLVDYVIPTYINGEKEMSSATATFNTLAYLKGLKSTDKLLRNGYVMNLVDEDENGEIDKVVITIEYLAKVTKVNAETASDKRSVNLEVYDNSEKLTVLNVETEDFAKDQFILITPSTNGRDGFKEPLEMKAAEVITGSVSAYYKDSVKDNAKSPDGSVTVDGVKYNYNAIFARDNKAYGEELANDGYTLGEKATYNFYLDSLGYVIGVEVADDSISDYAYIIAKGEDAFKHENIAKVLLSNGTVATYTISSKSDDDAYDDGTASDPCAGKGSIWGYSINSAGEIVLTELTGKYSDVANTTINSFTKGTTYVTYDTSKFAYATDETVFIYYNNDKVVGMYTGKDNAPNITNKSASVAIKLDSKNVPYVQFVVVTAAPEALTSDNFVYALSDTYVGYSTDNNGDKAYYFEVIKENEKVVIATDKDKLVKGQVYNYGVKEDVFAGDSANNVLPGLYDLTAMASGVATGVEVANINANVITDKSNTAYVISADTVIVDVDTDDSTTSIVFEATVETGNVLTVVYDVVGGLKITKAIYITDTKTVG